jgi:hypothetical protein
MLATTLDVVRSALKADPTVTPADRARLIALLKNGKSAAPILPTPAPKPRILRRAEAAERLGRSVRSIDMLCAEGSLQKIKFPGRKHFAGISESSLLALMGGASFVNDSQ